MQGNLKLKILLRLYGKCNTTILSRGVPLYTYRIALYCEDNEAKSTVRLLLSKLKRNLTSSRQSIHIIFRG